MVGRREASQKRDAGQASLVLPDRMVSGQHLAIAPAPEEGTFEITDLSSTNGTVVDGEAVESTMKLRDGAIIFVGSHVIVFRVATSAQLAAIQEELARAARAGADRQPELRDHRASGSASWPRRGRSSC